VDPLRRKVEDAHRRHHEVGAGVAPARHLHRRLQVVFDLEPILRISFGRNFKKVLFSKINVFNFIRFQSKILT
jgi:hypothetical protein